MQKHHGISARPATTTSSEKHTMAGHTTTGHTRQGNKQKKSTKNYAVGDIPPTLSYEHYKTVQHDEEYITWLQRRLAPANGVTRSTPSNTTARYTAARHAENTHDSNTNDGEATDITSATGHTRNASEPETSPKTVQKMKTERNNSSNGRKGGSYTYEPG